MTSYCGIEKLPKDKKRGTMKECAEAGQIRYYGIKKIDEKLVEHVKKSKKKKTTQESAQDALKIQVVRIRGRLAAIKRELNGEKDKSKIKKLKDEQEKISTELKKLLEKLKNMLSRKASRSSRKKSSKKSKKK